MGSPATVNEAKFAHFIAILTDPSWFDATQNEIAEEIGVHPVTISKWKSKVDWDKIRDVRRDKYAERTVRVDDAVFRSACKGDTSAQKLWFERFDGWVPATKVHTEHSLEDGLIDDEIKYLADRRIATASAIAESGPVDGQGRGEIPGPTSGEGPEAKG